MSDNENLQTPIEEKTELPKRKRRGCCLGCMIVVLSFGFPAYWFGIHTPPLRVSYKTTRVLGPMTSDGKRVDYFLALEEKYYPPEMKTDENGYRMIVRALGCPKREMGKYNRKTGKLEFLDVDIEFHRRQIYEKLGLDPDVPPTLFSEMKEWSNYTAVKEEVEKRKKEDPELKIEPYDIYNQMLRRPWTLEEFPFMEDWLKESAPAIDLLAEAVRKPAFWVPYTRQDEKTSTFESLIPLENMQMFREWARTVSCRARYRLGTGDIDGAIDDIITIHRIGRHAGRQGTLVSSLVGIAIEGVAAAIGIGENPEHPPTKEQIERLVKELDELPPRITYEECIETERYFGLSAIQDMYWGMEMGDSEPLPFPLASGALMRWSVDINVIMERANEIYDKIIDGTIDEKMFEEQPWDFLSFCTPQGRAELMMKPLGSLLLPSTQAAREAWRRTECYTNMQRLTLALLLYEKDHGGILPNGPEGDWRKAVRPYLGKNPDGYFHCPSHRTETDETTYAMIGGVDNTNPTPFQILLVEVVQPQKLEQGDGRFPLEKAKFWKYKSDQPRPQDFDGLGSFHVGGMNVGFRNGSVRFLSERNTDENMQKMLDGSATEYP